MSDNNIYNEICLTYIQQKNHQNFTWKSLHMSDNNVYYEISLLYIYIMG